MNGIKIEVSFMITVLSNVTLQTRLTMQWPFSRVMCIQQQNESKTSSTWLYEAKPEH